MYSEFQESFTKLVGNDTVHLLLDLTTKQLPPGYSQLLIAILYSYEKDMYMPIFHCLMQDKSYHFAVGTFDSYFLDKIKVLLESAQVRPRYLTCGFKSELYQSLIKVFPTAIYVGSFFQYAHRLWKKCGNKQVALVTEKDYKTTKAMLFELMGLSFIDPFRIQEQFAQIEAKYRSQGGGFGRFLDYYRRRFLDGEQSVQKWCFYDISSKSLESSLVRQQSERRIAVACNVVEALHSQLIFLLTRQSAYCVDIVSAIKIVENMRKTEFETYMEAKKPMQRYVDELLVYFLTASKDPLTTFKYYDYNEESYILELDQATRQLRLRFAQDCRPIYDQVEHAGPESVRSPACERTQTLHTDIGGQSREQDSPIRYSENKKQESNGGLKKLDSHEGVSRPIPPAEWPLVKPLTLFTGPDSTVYYKKVSGEVIPIDKLAESTRPTTMQFK